MIHVHDTLSGKLIPFTPLSEFEVKMYVCGPTVYDDAHIGHARAYIAYDIVYRYLNYKGYNTTYVRNLTDIDDKIINRAKDEGVDFKVIAERYTDSFHEDMLALGLQSPDQEPKATEVIPEIIAMIETLIAKGKAYSVANGDVYFSVAKHEGYGKLSKRKLDQLKAGARVAPNEIKQDPLDFALWKHSKDGEPSWQSPWGQGRPGWHIECSAMNKAAFGDSIDIHAGGRDLIFPHHENEIAQSEACNEQLFAKYWLHNGFVTTKNEKMSKSLGNVTNIKGLLKQVHPEALKLYFLSTHYRHPLEFSLDGVLEVAKGLNRLYRALSFMEGKEVDHAYVDQFTAAMDEDFNSAKAVSVLFDLIHAIHKAEDSQKGQLANTLEMLANIIGLLQHSVEDYQAWYTQHYNVDVTWVEQKIAERNLARKERQFEQADLIRNELERKNIQIEDAVEGSTWCIKL